MNGTSRRFAAERYSLHRPAGALCDHQAVLVSHMWIDVKDSSRDSLFSDFYLFFRSILDSFYPITTMSDFEDFDDIHDELDDTMEADGFYNSDDDQQEEDVDAIDPVIDGDDDGDDDDDDDDDDDSELERLYNVDEVPPLTRGHLYAEHPANLDELYEEYHRLSEEMEMGMDQKDQPGWESLEKRSSKEGATLTGTILPLPPANYALAVGDDVYQRMFKEVAESRTMPCGLFFCGHHEDVRYPSIWIATTLVLVLFLGLFYLAFYTQSFVDAY